MELEYRNVLALAYVGDSVYEIYVRKYLFENGIEKVNELQKRAKEYVSAKGQAKYLKEILDHDLLTEKEKQIVLRARNHKSHASPKNTDIITYKMGTALEALIGYLFLSNQKKRVDEIMNFIMERE